MEKEKIQEVSSLQGQLATLKSSLEESKQENHTLESRIRDLERRNEALVAKASHSFFMWCKELTI